MPGLGRQRWKGILRDGLQGLGDLVWPPSCPGCHARPPAPEQMLCHPCLQSFMLRPEWCCPRCGAGWLGSPPRDASARCRLCPPDEAPYQGVLGATAYHDVAARVVHGFKYGRRLELGEWMGRQMSEQLGERLNVLRPRIQRIVPVPLFWARRYWRGFNQSQSLAEALAVTMDRPLDRKLLRRHKHTRQQVSLPRERRAANVRGAFSMGRGAALDEGREGILVVDDVVTTGATVSECARILLEAGAREVWIACFAQRGLPRPEEYER